MFRVRRKAFQAIRDEFPQRTDIFVFRGKNPNQSSFCIEFCLFSVPVCRFRKARFVIQLHQKVVLRVECFPNGMKNRLLIEIRVCNGGEKVHRNLMIHVAADILSFYTQRSRNSRKAFGHIDEQILHGRDFRFLSTDAGHRATFASGCFLTLKAKHFMVH